MSSFRDRRRHVPAGGRAGRFSGVSLVGSAVIVLVLQLLKMAAITPPGTWTASFPARTSLITNERAYTQPLAIGVPRSDDWLVTSGSLFSRGHAGWTGPLDGDRPDLRSKQHTGSAVFRAVTRRADFRDVIIDFDLQVARMTTTQRTGKHAYDGVHVFLRYRDPQTLYTVSVDRRDHLAVVKIKRPGGPSNGGEYTTLGSAALTVPPHRWLHEKVRIANERGGVRITLWTAGREVLTVLNNGSGPSAPLLGAGRVGLRGDNTEFLFRNFTVSPA
jgi:hypothetical protein